MIAGRLDGMWLRWVVAALMLTSAGCKPGPEASARTAVGSADSASQVTDAGREPGDDEASPTEAAAARTGWRPLGSWSGAGELQTGSFDVTTGSLRLIWAAEDGDADTTGWLRVSLHSAISGRPLQTVVDVTGPGADTVLVASSPRVAYLLIESRGMRWRAVLQEGQLRGGD